MRNTLALGSALLLGTVNGGRIDLVADRSNIHSNGFLSDSSDPTELTPCGGYLYFQGMKSGWGGFGNPLLYRYDGTVVNGGFDSDPSSIEEVAEGEHRYLTCFKNELYYFKKTDTGAFSGIWQFAKFDGQETILYDTEDDYNMHSFRTWSSWFHGRYIDYESELYFGVTDKLLKTNGQNVSVVWDMRGSLSPKSSWSTIALPHSFVKHRGSLYFLAETPAVSGESLWKYDKASGGSLVVDLEESLKYAEKFHLFKYKDGVFLCVNYPSWASSDEVIIYKLVGDSLSDSGMASASLESSTIGSSEMSWIGSGEEFNGSLFLGARAKVPGEGVYGFAFYDEEYQLWEFDGSKTELAVDAASVGNPKFGWEAIEWITSFDDKLFFTTSSGTGEYYCTTHLWAWDGVNTAAVQSALPCVVSWLTPFDGRLYMNGKTEKNGFELWVYTPDGWTKPVSSKPTHGPIARPTEEESSDWDWSGLDDIDYNRDGEIFGEEEVQDLMDDILDAYDSAYAFGNLALILVGVFSFWQLF